MVEITSPDVETVASPVYLYTTIKRCHFRPDMWVLWLVLLRLQKLQISKEPHNLKRLISSLFLANCKHQTTKPRTREVKSICPVTLKGLISSAYTWENMPKGVCSVRMTWPLPPHVEHILFLEPTFAPVPEQASHVSKWESSNSFSAPNMVSENCRVMS